MHVLAPSWRKMTNLPEGGDGPRFPRDEGSSESGKTALADLLIGDVNLDEFLNFATESFGAQEQDDRKRAFTQLPKDCHSSYASSSDLSTSVAPSFSKSSSSSSLYQADQQGATSASSISAQVKQASTVVKHSHSDSETESPSKKRRKTLTSRASSSSTPPARARTQTWTRFTHIEEVILVGAIMKRFFMKGSLTSSTSEDCWETIKAYYDRAWKIYSEKEKVRTPQERTKESLGRHFKFMKAKLSKRDTSARHLRHYFTEWEGLNISLD